MKELKIVGSIFDISAIIFMFLLIFYPNKEMIIKFGVPIWITQLILYVIRTSIK